MLYVSAFYKFVQQCNLGDVKLQIHVCVQKNEKWKNH